MVRAAGVRGRGRAPLRPDYPLYLFLRRGELSLHLSEHLGDAPPGSLVRLYVEDLDSVAEEFDVPVEEQPWGRELELTDPDGNRLRVAPAVRS